MRALLVLALAASPARADLTPDPSYSALPCRPTIACTADFVPPGVVELEAGYIFRRLGSGANENALPFLLKLTLVEWAQLQIGSNGETWVSGEHYFDDVTAGVKLRFHRQSDHVPALSASATISIPTAAATGYVRTYDALFTAYATKDFDWLHADLNVGLNVWRLEDAPLTQAWIALALSVQIGHGFGAMLESYYFSSAAPVSPRDAGVLAAISYQPRKWIVLDAGPDLGLVPATRTASAFVGVTIIPLDLWDTDDERHAHPMLRL